MAANDNKLLGLLGFSVTGDCGPYTFYTSRRRKIVFYPRMPALNPPSAVQQYHRKKWWNAAYWWQRLLEEERTDWERAARGAHLRITGYNLWVFWSTTGRDDIVQTIERQSGVDLFI